MRKIIFGLSLLSLVFQADANAVNRKRRGNSNVSQKTKTTRRSLMEAKMLKRVALAQKRRHLRRNKKGHRPLLLAKALKTDLAQTPVEEVSPPQAEEAVTVVTAPAKPVIHMEAAPIKPSSNTDVTKEDQRTDADQKDGETDDKEETENVSSDQEDVQTEVEETNVPTASNTDGLNTPALVAGSALAGAAAVQAVKKDMVPGSDKVKTAYKVIAGSAPVLTAGSYLPTAAIPYLAAAAPYAAGALGAGLVGYGMHKAYKYYYPNQDNKNQKTDEVNS